MKSDTLEGLYSDREIHQGINPLVCTVQCLPIVGSNWVAIKAWVIEFIYFTLNFQQPGPN